LVLAASRFDTTIIDEAKTLIKTWWTPSLRHLMDSQLDIPLPPNNEVDVNALCDLFRHSLVIEWISDIIDLYSDKDDSVCIRYVDVYWEFLLIKAINYPTITPTQKITTIKEEPLIVTHDPFELKWCKREWVFLNKSKLCYRFSIPLDMIIPQENVNVIKAVTDLLSYITSSTNECKTN